jgi:hypothetical protein
VIAKRPHACGTHFTAYAYLRQKLVIDRDEHNGNVATYLYVFGGQIVFPPSDVRKTDFVVTSSDILHIRNATQYEYNSVCESIVAMNKELLVNTRKSTKEEVVKDSPEAKGKLF